MAPAVVQAILERGGEGWFTDQSDALIRAFDAAVQEGRKIQGGNVNRWNYGKYNELTIKHPVGGQLPVLASYFNIGPVEMSGSSTTIKQTTQRLGPSMRFIADLSDWDRSLNNITIGESGQFLSRHFKDQWDAYYAGRSFPMQFNNAAVKDTLTIQPK